MMHHLHTNDIFHRRRKPYGECGQTESIAARDDLCRRGKNSHGLRLARYFVNLGRKIGGYSSANLPVSICKFHSLFSCGLKYGSSLYTIPRKTVKDCHCLRRARIFQISFESRMGWLSSYFGDNLSST